MLLHSGLRIMALVIAPTLFSLNLDRDLSDHPRVTSIEPQVASPGDVVAALGSNLDRSRVAELMLASADGTAITHIVEQGPDLIRFRVPVMLDPGVYRIVLAVDRRWGTTLIDQDVVLTVAGVNRSALGLGIRGVSKKVELLHFVAKRVAGNL